MGGGRSPWLELSIPVPAEGNCLGKAGWWRVGLFRRPPYRASETAGRWLGAIGFYRRPVRGAHVNLSAAGREPGVRGRLNSGPRVGDILLWGRAGYGGCRGGRGSANQNRRGGTSCTMRRGWRRGCLWEDRALPPDLWGRTSCTIARWVVQSGLVNITSHFDPVVLGFNRSIYLDASWGRFCA